MVRPKRFYLVASGLYTLGITAGLRGQTLYSSQGFEPGAGYKVGLLAGQGANDPPVWQYATTAVAKAGASLVTVQSNTAYAGVDALQFQRGASDMDTYFAPAFSVSPAAQRYVDVSWQMLVNPGAASDPFFGIYAFNGSFPLCYAGIDATTGHVEESSAKTGTLVTSASTVPLGAWNRFDLQLDFSSQTQTLYVNGASVYSVGLIYTNQTSMTDADITSFASNYQQTGVGTAYFDNYQVTTSSNSFTPPAKLTWSDAAGGGHRWDTTTSNFQNGSNTALYHDGDSVTFGDPAGGSYSVVINSVVTPGAVTVNNSAGNYVFSGSGGIGGQGALTKAGPGTLTLLTADTYSGNTIVNGGKLVLGSSASFPSDSRLLIAGGAQLTVAPHGAGAPYVIDAYDLNNAGSIDLSNNDLIIRNASLAAISTQAGQGYAGGTWNGPAGISSSTAASDSRHLTALGTVLNDVGGGPLYGSTGVLGLFDGTSPPLDAVLVKYTYYGDTNLSGVVDSADYSRIDNAYLNNLSASNAALTGWFNGDFNYDGVINGSDFTLIDNAFNSQGASLAAANPAALATDQIAGVAAVPEPTGITVLASGALFILRRRRRHA